jgi:ATP-dependent helicase HrpA
MGRMLLEAAKLGSLQEVLIVASAMSIQDPRERPPERQQAADQAHAQWKDGFGLRRSGQSVAWFRRTAPALTASPLRNWCRKNFLNYLRLREWRDSHRQLSLICRDMQLSLNKEPADYRNCTSGAGRPAQPDRPENRRRRLPRRPSAALLDSSVVGHRQDARSG